MVIETRNIGIKNIPKKKEAGIGSNQQPKNPEKKDFSKKPGSGPQKKVTSGKDVPKIEKGINKGINGKIQELKISGKTDNKKIIEGNIKKSLPKPNLSNVKKEIKKEINNKTPQKAAIKKPKIDLKIGPEIKDDNIFDMAKLKSELENSLRKGKIDEGEAQVLEQRIPVTSTIRNLKEKSKGKTSKKEEGFILTGVSGFDQLFQKGIPKGSSIIVAGGTGSGKTILCLQTLINKASEGKKCFYMSFEESEKRLIKHMDDFGWNPKKFMDSGNLMIKRYSPFDITRSVEAMLAKEKGELLIEIDPIIIPKGYHPDFIIVDSLTAIASAFSGKEDSYRIYIEQLFRFFERLNSTSFLITETTQIPEIFSSTGVEEFLADGVIVLYSIKRGNIRENAIEVLKLRGAKHQKKIVAMQIGDYGVEVYPEQEVFGGIGGEDGNFRNH